MEATSRLGLRRLATGARPLLLGCLAPSPSNHVTAIEQLREDTSIDAVLRIRVITNMFPGYDT